MGCQRVGCQATSTIQTHSTTHQSQLCTFNRQQQRRLIAPKRSIDRQRAHVTANDPHESECGARRPFPVRTQRPRTWLERRSPCVRTVATTGLSLLVGGYIVFETNLSEPTQTQLCHPRTHNPMRCDRSTVSPEASDSTDVNVHVRLRLGHRLIGDSFALRTAQPPWLDGATTPASARARIRRSASGWYVTISYETNPHQTGTRPV